MATGSEGVGLTGDDRIDGILAGARWNDPHVTFNFPTARSFYPSDGSYGAFYNHLGGFVPGGAGATLQAMVRAAFAEYAKVSRLTFGELGVNDATANISVALTGNTSGFSGVAYYPDQGPRGDVWLSSRADFFIADDTRGDQHWRLVLHEIGHALGLKHAHDPDPPGGTQAVVPAAFDYSDYTVMSYRRTVGGPADESGNERFGNSQTLMMLDIAALQAMYGANYDTESGDTVYRWNPATGAMAIDGVPQATPGANRIYQTVWDGGGVDTYDLSNYATDLRIDLAPGGYSVFDDAQRAVLDVRAGVSALGNVFNALLHQDDPRSLIENARGGAGDDLIRGNQAANTLLGGAGADDLRGLAGRDVLIGDGAVTLDAAAQTVRQLYLGVFDRGPDAPGWTYWTDALNDGRPLAAVAAAFLAAPEARRAYEGLDDSAFARAILRNAVDREPGAGELAAAVAALGDGGLARPQWLADLAGRLAATDLGSSSLHAGQIFRLYDTVLGRAPEAPGFEFWTEALGGGRPIGAVASAFVAAGAARGPLDDAGFVSMLYRNAFGRAPDADGLAYWTDRLADGLGRAQAALAFTESREAVAASRAALDAFMRTAMMDWSDTLIGGLGDDRLTGGRGSDRYVFIAAESGRDTIYGFESFDSLELRGFGFATEAEALAAMRQEGADVVLRLGEASITFEDAQLATLQEVGAAGWIFG